MTAFLTMTLIDGQLANSQVNYCNLESIKYISTFKSSRMWQVMGGDANWTLANVKACVEMAQQDKMVLFFIPVMLHQIKNYYERDEWTKAEKEFGIEVSNFFATTLDNEDLKISNGDNKTFCQGLDKLKQAFYALCEDDNVFYKMIYTMDDGPFFGIDTDLNLPVKDSLKLEDIGAKMYIRQQGKTCTLELVDSYGQTKWKKIIARSADNYIKDIVFTMESILDKNELGYKIGLIGSGEFIHLYLRTDGAFRLYYHSW